MLIERYENTPFEWRGFLFAADTDAEGEQAGDDLEPPEDDDEELRQENDGYEKGERFVVEDDEDEGEGESEEKSSQNELIQNLVTTMKESSGNNNDDTASAIRDLVQEMKQQNKPAQEDPQKTAEQRRQEYENLKKDANENFWDKPVEYIEKLMQHNSQSSKEELYPLLNQIVGNVSESSKKISRTAAREDATNALVLDNYKDEVEEEVKQLPATADVYNQACQRVAQRHISDIVQMQVEEQLQKKRRPKPTRRASNQSPQGRSDQASKSSTRSVAEGQYRVSRSDYTKVQKLASARGVDEETAYNYLVDKGEIKSR